MRFDALGGGWCDAVGGLVLDDSIHVGVLVSRSGRVAMEVLLYWEGQRLTDMQAQAGSQGGRVAGREGGRQGGKKALGLITPYLPSRCTAFSGNHWAVCDL
jgi:hypothetical protein